MKKSSIVLSLVATATLMANPISIESITVNEVVVEGDSPFYGRL